MQHPQVINQFLSKLLSHTRMDAEEQQAIRLLSEFETSAPAHSDVVRRGQSVNSSCLVAEGLLARTRQTASGQTQITAFYIAGDMPDVHALITSSALTTLHALTPSRIIRVPRASVRDAVRKHPIIAEALWRESLLDATIAMEWIANIGQREAKSRIAHLFCEMVVRLGVGNGNCFRVVFPATQNNLAEATGMSPVHVNRSLQGLRADSIVDLREHHIYVEDWYRLQQIAGFDAGYLGFPDPQRLLF